MNELTPDEHRILVGAIHDSAIVIHKGQRMNEQIRKLIEKSYYECPQVTSYMWENHIVPPEQWTKFAELMVSQFVFELMHESTKQSSAEIQDFSVTVANRIKQHFGVKE